MNPDKLIMLQAKAYYLRKVLDKVEHAIELEEARRSSNDSAENHSAKQPPTPQEPKK